MSEPLTSTASAPAQPADYFGSRGYLDLALSLLQSSVDVLRRDPDLRGADAQFEYAWLSGRIKDSPITAETVLATLKLDAWAAQFAELALHDPKAMRDRLYGLGPILAEMAEINADNEAQAQLEATLETYRERARAC